MENQLNWNTGVGNILKADYQVGKYWEKIGVKIHCELCPHSCMIPRGKSGRCKVRSNKHSVLETPYGNLSSAHVDPVEKKPLFHFHPSTYVYSIGGWGCNLSCKNCQNYQISQVWVVNSAVTAPEEICKRALSKKCSGIAFTYNEPTTWYEFMEDTAAEARENGLYTVCVTNGYIQKEPMSELLEYIDAFNIDVKSFSDQFYQKYCGGTLKPVLESVELAAEHKNHIELTYLVIPGINDSHEELEAFSNWVRSINERIPVHFNAFHPCFELRHLDSTPISTLLNARQIGYDQGLKYVYLGNVNYPSAGDTVCPRCGRVAVRRVSTRAQKTDGICRFCNEELNMVVNPKDNTSVRFLEYE